MSLSRREIWARRIARYSRTELTVKEFCRREGVSQPSFYQWKRTLAEDCRVGLPTFLPVCVREPAVTDFTMRLPGGATIELSTAISPGDLRQIIAAVVSATDSQVAS